MTTTIEAMKQAQHLLRWTHFGECRTYPGPVPEAREVDKLLTEAIAAEEAQGVEPVAEVVPCYTPSGKRVALNTEYQNLPIGTELFTRPAPPASNEALTVKLELMTAERDKLLLELGDLRALRAARPAPPSDHIGDATELVGERAALIEKLKWAAKVGGDAILHVGGADTCKQAADMLAADAQTSPSHPQFVAGFKAGHAAGKRREDAQQVAVPQEKDKLCEGLSTGQVMQKAFAWCPTDHPHKLRMQWIADYFIANAPQADALAADHVEDVRAMVPMTDQELDDLLPTNDSMSRKDSQRWIARATERHHKIGVKP